MTGNQPTPKNSISQSPPMPRSGSVLAARQLRCPTQKRTRYLAVKDIRGTIAERQSPAGPLLWQGLKYWLSTTSKPLSIDTSRYSRSHSVASPASYRRTGTRWLGQSFPRLLEYHVGSPRGSPRGRQPTPTTKYHNLTRG
jgi:hypothetical protein